MFIIALFTVAKLWKQPRCLLTEEWIQKIWYLYTMEFYSDTKKNEILSFSGKWTKTEEYHLQQSKTSSEGQKSHVLSHLWHIDITQM
jgi:hypothetical protein